MYNRASAGGGDGNRAPIGGKAAANDTVGRFEGEGSSSVMSRNKRGTRPFTGDVKRKVSRDSYASGK